MATLIKSKKAYSLVELLIVMGIMGILFLFTANLMDSFDKEKAKTESLVSLFNVKFAIQKALMSTYNWNQIMSADSRMSCFSGSTATSCLAINSITQNGLRIYNGNDILFDGTNPNSGYTKKGTPCNTFGSSSDADCYYRPNISWRAECNLTVDSTCSSPIIIIDVNFQVNGSTAESINLGAYNFTLNKSTFPIIANRPCGGAIPACTGSQQAVCKADGIWTCLEFSP